MIDAICNKLTLKIRKKMPEVNDERAEVINYGLQLLIGEIPKTLLILFIAWILGVFKLTVLAVLVIVPYRAAVGGVHFKTHIKCIFATSLFYIGNALLSKYLILGHDLQLMITFLVWVFSITMITLYAPADTVDVPILRKNERTLKKILSYIIMSVLLIVAIVISNKTLSNLIIFGVLLQTIAITRPMYILANNKYGYEEYIKGNLKIAT